MTTPTETKRFFKAAAAPKHDLVKHLASKGARPGWILLGIIVVTLGDVLKSLWWVGPCIVAAIARSYIA